jgi:isopentenyl phosphate kinase
MSRLVIKLGGSFITQKRLSNLFPTGAERIEKEAPRFLREENLKAIAREIRAISDKHDLVILHGAGPFGHALVERILAGEPIDPRDVHRSMLTLNSIVLKVLALVGMKCRTSSPFDHARFDTDYDTRALVAKMIGDLAGGLVPVSHGDILPTRGSKGRLGGYEVVSADVLARDIALGWPADRIVMVTDTDGILDRDPAVGPGRRMPRIPYSRCIELLKNRGGVGADVTGGIGQKVMSCRVPISRGIPLQIISGAKKGSLLAASDAADVGTTIEIG